MTKAARFHPAALEELTHAAERYDLEREGLGDDFASAVEGAIGLIRRYPGAWQTIGGGGERRFMLERFPFSIVYREVDDGVHIVAVAHTRREPAYWQGRR